MKRLKIVYVAPYDARDVTSWSGTGYHIVEALKMFADVIYVDKLEKQVPFLHKVKHGLYKYLIKSKKYDYEREHVYSKNFARQIEKRLPAEYDMIFCAGSIPVAYVNSPKPIIIWTDASFASMINFYSKFTNLTKDIVEKGNKLEQQAFDNCSMAIFSSHWAVEGVKKYYKVDSNKLQILPFGANIRCDRTEEDITHFNDVKSRNTCKLLFLGIDWVRKGGEAAVEIARRMNEQGIKTELHMAGIKEPMMLPDFVINHGYLSKHDEADTKKLNQLFEQSHFLILPSIAECTAIVFNEACSYGLPVLTSNVGGSPSIVKADINGKTFALDDHDEYVSYAKKYFTNFKAYSDLSHSSFQEFKNRLNWNSVAKELEKKLNTLVLN